MKTNKQEPYALGYDGVSMKRVALERKSANLKDKIRNWKLQNSKSFKFLDKILRMKANKESRMGTVSLIHKDWIKNVHFSKFFSRNGISKSIQQLKKSV